MFANIKNKSTFVLVSLIVSLTFPVFADEQSSESIISKNKSAIVKIFTKGKKEFLMGFGFIIQPDGLVLTNNHVIESSGFVVEGPKYKDYQIEKIVFRDKKNDLVLMKIAADQKLPVVALGNSDRLKIGDKLITLNNLIEGELKGNNSIVVKIVNTPATGSSIVLLENAYQINNAMEGSPVFDQSGEVVGVLSSANDDTSILGLTMAPINMLHENKIKIKDFLKDYKPSKKGEPEKVELKDEKDFKVSVNKRKNLPKESPTARKVREIQEKLDLEKANTRNKPVKPEPNDEIISPKVQDQPVKPVKPVQSHVQNKTIKPKVHNQPVKPEQSHMQNDFGINLSGYWFDIDTGHSIYLESNNGAIVMRESESELTVDNKKVFKGSFKRDGNKYVGSIEGMIDCKDNIQFKRSEKKDVCVINEEAELVNWDDTKIELNVNSINAYSCKECMSDPQTSWKNRMWLRKNKQN